MCTPTLKELVIIHINYRDVFNAAVSFTELQHWIGSADTHQVKQVLHELLVEGLVETDNNLNYYVAGRSEIVRHRAGKKRLSIKCLKKHEKIIEYLSWMPFVRFIGISGSIAVENATLHKDGLHKNSVDLDIFVITASNSLWLVFYVERLLTNILTLLLGRRYIFCFNYAMDSSFLEIHNKNMYTATELFNLKPVYNKDNTYQLLLKSNSWANTYYPALSSSQTEIKDGFSKTNAREFGSVVRYPFNLFAFYLFHLSRVVKNVSLKPLSKIKLKFDPALTGNLKRICSANGGYENPIMERFESGFKKNFSNYYRPDLIQYLFPKQEKVFPADQFLEKLARDGFTKYSIS